MDEHSRLDCSSIKSTCARAPRRSKCVTCFCFDAKLHLPTACRAIARSFTFYIIVLQVIKLSRFGKIPLTHASQRYPMIYICQLSKNSKLLSCSQQLSPTQIVVRAGSYYYQSIRSTLCSISTITSTSPPTSCTIRSNSS